MGPVFRSLKNVAWNLPLDAKRPVAREGDIQSWYPYYAGFSEIFARTVLSNSLLPASATVLDPWNGSGTTTYVAEQLGFEALGFDINPVASIVANAKLARPRDAEHVLGLAKRIAKIASSRQPSSQTRSDALVAWLSRSLVAQYRAMEAEILLNLATSRSGIPVRPDHESVPPLASFLLLALMRAARSIARIRAASNPTWIVPEERRHLPRRILAERWLHFVQLMAEDLALRTKITAARVEVRLGDARMLPISNHSIDLVLTSPPYCTRIDYTVSTSFELATLGLSKESEGFKALRQACMGSPIARAGRPAPPPESWPEHLSRLLFAIKNHPSKSSSSYYYKMFRQYFGDCEASLLELRRCLKPAATAVLVVQSSYYKDIYIDLPRIYVEMAQGLGFQSEIVSQAEVKRALVSINSRSRRHRESTRYEESILVIENSP